LSRITGSLSNCKSSIRKKVKFRAGKIREDFGGKEESPGSNERPERKGRAPNFPDREVWLGRESKKRFVPSTKRGERAREGKAMKERIPVRGKKNLCSLQRKGQEKKSRGRN